jgi:hypothetical protein
MELLSGHGYHSAWPKAEPDGFADAQPLRLFPIAGMETLTILENTKDLCRGGRQRSFNRTDCPCLVDADLTTGQAEQSDSDTQKS